MSNSDTPRAIRRILVATGLTQESVGGVYQAIELAGRIGAELHAAHVIQPVSERQEAAIPGLAGTHVEHAKEEFAKFARTHGLEGRAQLHVLHGEPEHELLALRKHIHADLLVLGRYGKGGLKRGTLGSVATDLVRRSPVPTLVVQPEFRGPFMKIGVASELHDPSEPALRRAGELAGLLGVQEIALLHAYSVPVGYHTITTWEGACAQLERVAQEMAQRTIAGAAAHSPAGCRWRVVIGEGSPGTAVPRLALQEQLDLIVLGTHSRTAPARLLLDRTSEQIVHAASCSVWAEKTTGGLESLFSAFRELFD